MSPASPKKKQSSPLHVSRSYWFDLPDIAPRKKRRNRFRILLNVGFIGTAVLLTLACFIVPFDRITVRAMSTWHGCHESFHWTRGHRPS